MSKRMEGGKGEVLTSHVIHFVHRASSNVVVTADLTMSQIYICRRKGEVSFEHLWR